MSPRKQESQLNNLSILWSLLSVVDSMLTGTIYSCYISPALTLTYKQTLRFIFFPIYVFDALVMSACAWYWAHLERNPDGNMKQGKIVYAALVTVASVFMLVAAIASLTTQLANTILSPIFFAANMISYSLFNVGAAFYYWGKSLATPETLLHDQQYTQQSGEKSIKTKKDVYRERAIGHAIGGFIGLGVAMTAFVVVVLGKVVFSPAGTILGVIGAALNSHALYKSTQDKIRIHREKLAEINQATNQTADSTTRNQPANTTSIFKGIGVISDASRIATKIENAADDSAQQALTDYDYVPGAGLSIEPAPTLKWR